MKRGKKYNTELKGVLIISLFIILITLFGYISTFVFLNRHSTETNSIVGFASYNLSPRIINMSSSLSLATSSTKNMTLEGYLKLVGKLIIKPYSFFDTESAEDCASSPDSELFGISGGKFGIGTCKDIGRFSSPRLILKSLGDNDLNNPGQSAPLILSAGGTSGQGDSIGIAFVHPEPDGTFPIQKISGSLAVKARKILDNAVKSSELEVRLLDGQGNDATMLRLLPDADGSLIVGSRQNPIKNEMLLLETATSGEGTQGLSSPYRILFRLFARNPDSVGISPTMAFTSLGTDGEAHDIAAITASKEQQWTSDSSTQNGYLLFSTLKNGLLAEGMRITSSGNVGIGTNTPREKLDIVGNVRADRFLAANGQVLGDIAEPVVGINIQPGDVVVMNSFDETGNLQVSYTNKPYSKKVVGVISTNPSIVLAGENNKMSLAVAGIVPVKVFGLIEEGDLLTTSTLPGVAMRCADYDRCSGAIFGKALEAHTNEKIGTIRVLLSIG